MLSNAFWIVAAALSFLAAHLAASHATPIDAALPYIAVMVTFVAWIGRESRALLCSVPLLIACAIVFPADERTRLLGYGVIVGLTFAAAMLAVELTRWRAIALALAAIVVLRWIAREDVEWFRELVILAGAGLAASVWRRRFGGVPESAIALAILAALHTPAIPRRTLLIPFAVAAIALIVPRLRWVSVLAVALMLLLFPWSGVAARALPWFWRAAPVHDPHYIWWALHPGEVKRIELPDDAKALIVMAANATRLKRGTLLGTIEPGGIPIRIGDGADWGYARRDQYWKSRNGLPKSPAGQLRGYGYDAWIDGAGRLPLPRGLRAIAIHVNPKLEKNVRLQIEAVER